MRRVGAAESSAMSSTGTVIFRGAEEDEVVKVKVDDVSSGVHSDSDYE